MINCLALSLTFYFIPQQWKCEDPQTVMVLQHCVDKSTIIEFPQATPDNSHMEHAQRAFYAFVFVAVVFGLITWIEKRK